MIDLTGLKLLENNPRKISDEAMSRLKRSIERDPEFMEKRPIVTDKAMVVWGGNQRLKACLALGKKEVPDSWVRSVDWPEDKLRRFALVDNAPDGMSGGWDFDVLADWTELDYGDDFEFDELGFELEGYEPNIDTTGLTDDDAVPETPEEPKTKPGDLYLLGYHRLLCGDSTKQEDVERLMDGEKADMVFTDPPYGVAYADKNKYLNAIARGNRIQVEISGDHSSVDDLADNIIFPAFCRIKEFLNKRSSYYITAPQGGDLLMMMMMQKAGLVLRHMLIWAKNNHVLGRTDYNYKHEPILFGWVDVHDFYGNGDQKFSVWNVDKPLKNDLHPTMKPVELIVNALMNSTKKENICLDLFGGSGSTLIACEKTGRKCRMMEIDPHYCDVIVRRWEEFTGMEAKLAEKP